MILQPIIQQLKALIKETKSKEEECVDIQERYDLTSKILSAKSLHNEALRHFNDLCKNDFMLFANQESSLAEEAQALLDLQAIQEQLHVLCSFPDIFNKTIVAIGGGFSSGKSSLLNEIIDDKNIKLATGVNPVTALPSYITNGDSNKIKIYSIFDGSVDIEPSLYEKMSHDFLKTFEFNLQDIVHSMAIETNLKGFDNLCFIDTPGYNPAQISDQTDADRNMSKEYLKKAGVLLWVIGVDATGTIPTSDLEFLSDLLTDEQKLFIVLNKADLKTPSDMENIMGEVASKLEDYDIECEGIASYSSINKEEKPHQDSISLFEFLKQEDKEATVEKQIKDQLKSIFKRYTDAFKKDKLHLEGISSKLASVKLDLFQNISDDCKGNIVDSIESRIDKIIRKELSTSKLDEKIQHVKNLQEKMLEAVDGIFESLEVDDKVWG